MNRTSYIPCFLVVSLSTGMTLGQLVPEPEPPVVPEPPVLIEPITPANEASPAPTEGLLAPPAQPASPLPEPKLIPRPQASPEQDPIIAAQLRQAGLIQDPEPLVESAENPVDGAATEETAPDDGRPPLLSFPEDENSENDLPEFLQSPDNIDSLTNLSSADLLEAFPEDEFSNFGFSINVQERYSSNQNIASQGEDTLSTTISPNFRFRSSAPGTALLTLDGTYSPQFQTYQSGNFDDRLDHTGGIGARLEGSKTTGNLSAQFSKRSQSNRFAGGFTEQESTRVSLGVSRQVSAKTSLSAQVSYSNQSISTSAFGDTQTLNASIGGSYRLSDRTSFGPRFRYSRSEGNNRGTVNSMGLLLTGRYQASEKISVNGGIGLERSERENSLGDSNINPTFNVGFNYNINPLWGLRGNVSYSVVAPNNRARILNPLLEDDNLGQGFRDDNDPQINGSLGLRYSFDEKWNAGISTNFRTAPSFSSADETIEDLGINFNLTRTFATYSVTGNVQRSMTTFSSPSASANNRDSENTSFSLNFNYPGLTEFISLSASIRHQINSGRRDFEQTNATVGVTYRF